MAFRNQYGTINESSTTESEIRIQIPTPEQDQDLLESLPLLFKSPPEPEPAEPQPSSSWYSRTATRLSNGASAVKNSVSYSVKHPISTVLGLGTTAQPTISAFANPSKVEPREMNATWWAGLSGTTRLQSVIGLVASLSVNFPVNKKFIEEAWSKLKSNGKNTFKSVADFIDNITSIFLALNSGMAAAAITFEAFLWVTFGGILFPALFAGLSFLNASTSRYIGIKRVFGLVRNFFNFDAKTQRQSIDALKHLNLDYQVELDSVLQSVRTILQDLLDNKIHGLLETKHQLDENDTRILEQFREKELQLMAKVKAVSVEDLTENDLNQVNQIVNQKSVQILQEKCKLTEQDYEFLFKELLEKVAALETLHPDQIPADFYKEKQFREYVEAYATTVVKLVFGLVFGLSAASIFMQKYFDAINILSKFISHKDLNESNMNIWLKRLMGVPSGLASGLLYGASAAEFSKLFFVTLPTYLYSHPKEILSTVLLFTSNYYAAGSLQNVATGIVNRKDNILGPLSEGCMKELLPELAHAGCGFVNILAELKKRAPTPADPDHPTYEEIIHFFEDPNERKIEHETAIACNEANSKLRFFPKPSPKKPSQEQQELRPTSAHILTV